MNTKLLEPEVQQFIKDNLATPVAKLALQKNPFADIEWAEVLNQVAAHQKAESKLPTWFATDNIIYPSKISVEQTSSERTAQYKASLVGGEALIDLTGGFGIDDFYFSKNVDKVYHCELNVELSAIAAHNFKLLGADNIECIPGDSTKIIELLSKKYDHIYIDPARRNYSKGKVFMLKDCLPDVTQLLSYYFRYSDNIMIKTAPLLDISAGLGELSSVKAIHIVAVENEVKELLWLLEKDYTGEVALHAVNLHKEGEDIFVTTYDAGGNATYSNPKQYIYEPNSAIMKTGAFDAVSTHYGLDKLHRHTHLYTSENLVDFAGRSFELKEILPYDKKTLKVLENTKMNITTRNFPLQVEAIRKKWKLKDGGDTYAFFTTNLQNEKIVLLCAKIN